MKKKEVSREGLREGERKGIPRVCGNRARSRASLLYSNSPLRPLFFFSLSFFLSFPRKLGWEKGHKHGVRGVTWNGVNTEWADGTASWQSRGEYCARI